MMGGTPVLSAGAGTSLALRKKFIEGFGPGWHGQTCLPVLSPAPITGKLSLAHAHPSKDQSRSTRRYGIAAYRPRTLWVG